MRASALCMPNGMEYGIRCPMVLICMTFLIQNVHLTGARLMRGGSLQRSSSGRRPLAKTTLIGETAGETVAIGMKKMIPSATRQALTRIRESLQRIRVVFASAD